MLRAELQEMGWTVKKIGFLPNKPDFTEALVLLNDVS